MRLSLVGLLLISSVAVAQPATTADDEVAAGKTALENADFEKAIEHYTRANTLAPGPDRLWDLAEAHRIAAARLHATDRAKAATHRDAALALYKRFLDTHPDEEREVRARGWAAKLQAQYDQEFPAEEARRRDQAAREREEKIRAEEQRNAADRRTKAEEQRRLRGAVTKAHRDSELSKARIVKWSGLAAIGGGVVATGVGVYFGLEARSLDNELTESNVFDKDKIDQGERQEKYMAISYATAGGLLVGGAITYWIGRGIAARTESAPVIIAPASGGARVMFSGRF